MTTEHTEHTERGVAELRIRELLGTVGRFLRLAIWETRPLYVPAQT